MRKQTAFEKLDTCLMHDAAPSRRLRTFSREVWFKAVPFSILLEQERTEQSPEHHPEGNVWEHTLLVVDEAAKRKQDSSDPRTFMWAALLHDIGKPAATKIRKGRITAYDHDKIGAELASRFLSALTDDAELIERVMWLVRYHMQLLFVVKGLPFQDIPGMRSHTEVSDVALLGYCDRMGRLGADSERERNNVQYFIRHC